MTIGNLFAKMTNTIIIISSPLSNYRHPPRPYLGFGSWWGWGREEREFMIYLNKHRGCMEQEK